MSAQDKAKELVDRLKKSMPLCADRTGRNYFAKACAIIAVDLILEDYKLFNEKHKAYKVPSFWQEVKKQIELL